MNAIPESRPLVTVSSRRGALLVASDDVGESLQRADLLAGEKISNRRLNAVGRQNSILTLSRKLDLQVGIELLVGQSLTNRFRCRSPTTRQEGEPR